MKNRNPNSNHLKEIKYEVDKNGCWNCVSHTKDQCGYPSCTRGGVKMKVSRYFYQKYKGKIPEGMVMRHTCDNPSCINPEHLIIGTQKENIRDRVERGRGALGEKNGRSKLTEEQVIDILKSVNISGYKLAEKYGVKGSTIYDIRKRKNWKHINI